MKKVLVLFFTAMLIISSILPCFATGDPDNLFLMDYDEMVKKYQMQKISPEQLRQVKREYLENTIIYDRFRNDCIIFCVKDSDIPAELTDEFEMGDYVESVLKEYGIPDIGKYMVDNYDIWNDVGYKMMTGIVYLNKQDKQYALEMCRILNDNPFLCYAELDRIFMADDFIYDIGDVNADEAVDILDASIIQMYAVNKIDFCDEQKSFGDYNKDGVCDILDANAIQKALVSE